MVSGEELKMQSPIRITANRRNAIHSTGPLTAAGKMRASRNAIKHGLSISIRDDPKIPSMIDALALAITGSNPKARKLQAACDVAETYLEHRRLQEFKLALIRTDAASICAARNQSGNTQNVNEQLLDDNLRAYIRTLPLLIGIERYVSRVQSRQTRAFCAYSVACEEGEC